MRKLNLHWFCTQNQILEPFSVRRACTQCYVTSEPYPRPSQIWCQNVQKTQKKIVIKCCGESFAHCRVIARYVEGGGGHHAPPPSLIRVNPFRMSPVYIEARVYGKLYMLIAKSYHLQWVSLYLMNRPLYLELSLHTFVVAMLGKHKASLNVVQIVKNNSCYKEGMAKIWIC